MSASSDRVSYNIGLSAASADELRLIRTALLADLALVDYHLGGRGCADGESERGKSLGDCLTKWTERRLASKLAVRDAHLREVRGTIAAFEHHAGISSIHELRRRHVLAYRDHLATTSGYAVATINKKISFLSTLHATALNAGWIETPLGRDLLLTVPEDQGAREPYTDEHLTGIFSHPIFTRGKRLGRVKAGGDLQFWLPLIACLHGMISSEIVQLGPDTIALHPGAPDLWCFVVTTAGGRCVKSLARRRWMPVRRELIELGLLELVAAARRRGSSHLWPAMDQRGGNVTRVSGYFSSFWAGFSKRELGIDEEGLCLYSFRHAFQDRLGRAGYGEEVKKALMGHAESGMTGRYGTKKAPREVDVVALNDAVQALDWPFLSVVLARPPTVGGEMLTRY